MKLELSHLLQASSLLLAAVCAAGSAAASSQRPAAEPPNVPPRATADAETSCPTHGSGSVGDLHRAWILEGWERRDGEPLFVFTEKLGRFYDGDGDGVSRP